MRIDWDEGGVGRDSKALTEYMYDHLWAVKMCGGINKVVKLRK